ncbi:MAG: PIN domain-containing protein [Bifidobacteriaceae bacterium]|nr:PIN domain-containing protein [Bifidobacteriaceae bacterium]
MFVVDVNVLVAAHRADHPNHPDATAWIEAALARPDADVMVPDLVWVGFVRIVINRRIFPVASTLGDAAAFVDAVTGAPGYRPIAGLLAGIRPFLDLCQHAGASADLVPDAYIAAVAQRFACPVVTFDRDFRRFDGLPSIIPTAGSSK